MMRRWLLFPLLAITEIFALGVLAVLAFTFPDKAGALLPVLRDSFPDFCWYRGGPFLVPKEEE